MNEWPAPQLYSTPQAARFLGIPPRTLQHWVKRGWVQPTQRTLGGFSRFSSLTIAELREQLRGQGGVHHRAARSAHP